LKLKLKAKLLGSFGIVLIMMLAVAYLGISLGSHMNEDIIDLGNKQVVKVELVGDLNTNLQNIRRYQLQVIVKGQMGDLKNSTGYAQKIEEMIVESEQWNAELGSLMQTDAGKKAHLLIRGQYLWKLTKTLLQWPIKANIRRRCLIILMRKRTLMRQLLIWMV